MVLTILVQSEIVEYILGLKFNDEQYLGHCIFDYIWNSFSAFPFNKRKKVHLYQMKSWETPYHTTPERSN